jgi:hypothetical protein
LEYISNHPELQKEDPEFDAWTDKMIETYESFESKLPQF